MKKNPIHIKITSASKTKHAGPHSAIDRAPDSYWQKYVHEVLVNCLGGLSLPRKSVIRLTDRPDMTLDVYRRRKTTMQQQEVNLLNVLQLYNQIY